MRYLGGKSKIARVLAEVIGGGDILYEPFIGGGAMTAVLAQKFKTVIASDSHKDLILMWRALQQGWVPPTFISEDLYKELKVSPPSPLRAFAGFAGASWGGKWFGGYARGDNRNYADEASRSLLRDIQHMKNVIFNCMDYREVIPELHSTVYADPPYANTTGFSDKFDNIEFWNVMDLWSKRATVFVSEYTAPKEWTIVWEQERTRDMKADTKTAVKVVERVYKKAPIKGL